MATTLKNIEVAASHILNGLVTIAAFAFAGKASISIANTATGRRFSYHLTVARVRTEAGGTQGAAHGVGPWDVQVMTSEGWELIGYVFKAKSGLRFINGPRQRGGLVTLGSGALEVTAFSWLISRLREGRELPEAAQVWRGDECGRCGKELVSEYTHIGYGPICCGHLGINDKAIFRMLADLGEATSESEQVARIREMVYSDLTASQTALHVAPLKGIARDYANAHMAA